MKTLTVFFLIGCTLFGLVSSEAAPAPFDPPVFTFLINHGYMMDDLTARSKLSENLVKKIRAELAAARVEPERPVVVWLESSMPARLEFSVVDSPKFYQQLSKDTGYTVEQIVEILTLPPGKTDSRSKEIIEYLKALYAGNKKAKKTIHAGVQHLKTMPKDVTAKKLTDLSIAHFVEKAPFDAWIACLRGNLFNEKTMQAFVHKDTDTALKNCLYEQVEKQRKAILRDKKLANDVAAFYKKYPLSMQVIVRGAAHVFFTPELEKLGIKSKVIKEAELEDITVSADMYLHYQMDPKIYKPGYVLTQEEREMAMRSLMERFTWIFLIQTPSFKFTPENSGKICRLINAVPREKLDGWLKFTQDSIPTLDAEALATWAWLSNNMDLRKYL